MAECVAFERKILDEDLALQEQYRDRRLPLDLTTEVHVKADRMTIELRRILAELVHERLETGDHAHRRRRTGRSGPARSRPRRATSRSICCSPAAPSSTSGAASCARPTSASSVRSSRACTSAGARADALDVIDCTGRFVAPGFVDMHVHFESSMLTPGGYAEAVCPRGTTTVFVDPHELANVAGVAGVRYAVEASRGLPVRFIVQAPSCVPPQPGLELSGADLYGPDIAEMLSWDEVGGLAEVMDMLGVLGGADAHGRRRRRGHRRAARSCRATPPGLTGPMLQAYLAAGMTSDHEIFTEPDCLEKLRAGMTVELRGMIDPILPGHRRRGEQPARSRRRTSSPRPTTSSRSRSSTTAGSTTCCAGSSRTGWTRCSRCAARPTTPRTGCSATISASSPRAGAPTSSCSPISQSFTAEHVLTDGRVVASHGQMLVDVVEGPSDPPLDTMKLAHLDAVRHAVAARRARRRATACA